MAPPGVDATRITRAVSWNTLATGTVAAIQLGRSMILARLLKPDDYGLFGMAALAAATVGALTNFTAAGSVIVRSDADAVQREVVDSIWTFDVMRQGLVTLLLLAAAYPVGWYFRDPRVSTVLLITAFTPLINALSNIGLMLARKDMQFHLVSVHRIASEVALTSLSILLAVATRNVWALVFGQLVGTAISVVLSYWLHPYRPRLHYSRQAVAGSIVFARSMFVLTLFTFATTQFEQVVVGRYLGAAVLGAYLLAQRLATFPVDFLTESINSAMFPAFASLSKPESRALAVRALSESLALTAAVLSLTLLPMRLASRDIVGLLYGEQWVAAAGEILAVVTLAALLRGMARVFSPLLQGFGRAAWDARFKVVEAAVFVPLTLLLVPRFGLAGAGWAGVASYFVAAVMRFVAASRLLPGCGQPLRRVLGSITVGAAAGYAGALLLIGLGLAKLWAAGVYAAFLGVYFYATQAELRGRLKNTWEIAHAKLVSRKWTSADAPRP